MLTTSPTRLSHLRQPSESEVWARFVSLYTPLLLFWAGPQGFQKADARPRPGSAGEAGSRAADLQAARRPGVPPLAVPAEGQPVPGLSPPKATRALPSSACLSSVGVPEPVGEREEAEYRRTRVQRRLVVIRADLSECTWNAFTRVMVEGPSGA